MCLQYAGPNGFGVSGGPTAEASPPDTESQLNIAYCFKTAVTRGVWYFSANEGPGGIIVRSTRAVVMMNSVGRGSLEVSLFYPSIYPLQQACQTLHQTRAIMRFGRDKRLRGCPFSLDRQRYSGSENFSEKAAQSCYYVKTLRKYRCEQ